MEVSAKQSEGEVLEHYVTILEKAQDDPTNMMLLAVVAQGIRLCRPLKAELAKFKRVVLNVAIAASRGSFYVHTPISLAPYDGVSPSMTRGPVRIYRSQFGNQQVVCKELGLGNKQDQEAAQLSLALMSLLSHPNLQSTLGGDISSTSLRTATVLCDSGNLREFIGARPKNEQLQMQLIVEMITGVRFLHSVGIVHANLKPENVLVWSPRPSAQGSLVTLTDYGARGAAATAIEFRAPEVLNGAAPTEAADVYSLGVLAWMVLAWRSPVKNSLTAAELEQLKKRLMEGKDLPPIATEWPVQLRRMIKSCRADARDRPSASDLVLLHVDAVLEKERQQRKQAEQALGKANDKIIELEAELKLAKYGKRLRSGSVPQSTDAEANGDLTSESQLLRLGATLSKMKTKLSEWRMSEKALLEQV